MTFDLHLKNVILHITLLPSDIGFSYLACVYVYSLHQDLSGGNISFDHTTLIVTFDQLSKKINKVPIFLP